MIINKYRFVVRKYIFAENVQQAIKKEKFCPVHDCWIDPDWVKMKDEFNIGYDAPSQKLIGDKNK